MAGEEAVAARQDPKASRPGMDSVDDFEIVMPYVVRSRIDHTGAEVFFRAFAGSSYDGAYATLREYHAVDFRTGTVLHKDNLATALVCWLRVFRR